MDPLGRQRAAARERRRRLTDAVNGLDVAIQAGLVTPTRDELRALMTICQEQGLIDEACRVLQWLLQLQRHV